MRAQLKILRDLWVSRGRVAFMVLSMATGLVSLGTVVSARAILQREMNRNYMETVPASATFDIGEHGIDERTLEALRRQPQVAEAVRRSTRSARWRRPGQAEWGRAKLFVFDDFANQPIAKIKHEMGLAVPPLGTVLVERSAVSVLGVGVGQTIEVATSNGTAVALEIAGIVHEPALAPAVTEQAGYLYASPETLALLGESVVLDEIRILVAQAPLNPAAVEAQAQAVARWLVAQGTDVHEVRVPPPGQHPHQAPSEVVLLLFSIFAGLTVVLAAVLCASLLSITMARQAREIAIMKTLGATRRQIRLTYACMLAIIACLALGLAAGPTRILGRFAANNIAALINFDIASTAVPHWVYATQAWVGLVLPLLAAAPAINGASRGSVLASINNHGAGAARPGLERWISRQRNLVRQAALRNALRVPKRLLLTVCLLGVGGGLFIGAMSVADAWESMTGEVLRTRHYDIEVHLDDPPSPTLLAALGGLERVEPWGFAPVALDSESGLPLSRTYPDGSHGSFTLVGVPPDTQLIDFKLRSGQWLRPDSPHGIVLNQLAASRLGGPPIGGHVSLRVEGAATEWTVVGVVEEVASPAAAYVHATAFTEQTHQPVRALRVALGTSRDPASTQAGISALERTLGEQGAHVTAILPLQLLFNAMGAHVIVLVRALLGLALLMAMVSMLALSSSMSTSAVERTREFGVLRAVGARPRDVRRMVIAESLFVGVLSLPLALLIAVPLAAVVGYVVGMLSFGIALPLALSWIAVAVWTAGVIIVAVVASVAPARTATQQSVTTALSHV